MASPFRVLVGVKRVVDFAVKVRVNAAKTGVELNNVKMSMNPFCEIAVEEATRLKEKGIATEVIAVSVGPKTCQETLRTALAMGADSGVHVETDLRTDQDLQPLAVSKVFAALAKRFDPRLILFGKQSIDSDNGVTAQMLAGLLGWPAATFASKIAISEDKKSATVTREVDGGLQTVRFNLPALVSADLRLNEPRFATLPNIMKARKKQLEVIPITSLGIDFKPHIAVVSVRDPPQRKSGVKIDGVPALVDILKAKGFLK